MAGNFLEVQWLGHGTFTDEGLGSIPGWGNKILQALRHRQKQKKKKKKKEFMVYPSGSQTLAASESAGG